MHLVQMAEGRRKYTWPVLKLQINFSGVCGYCKKRAGHKWKVFPECNAKQSKVDLDLGTVRNVACMEGMDTLMLTVGKRSLIKLPKWYKDLSKKGETAGSSVEVVLATVDEPNSKEEDFHGACP